MPFVSEAVRSDDPRQPIHRLRRTILKRIVHDAGIEFNESTTTADDLRLIIKSNSIDVSPYLSEQHKLGMKEPASKRMKSLETENQSLRGEVDDLKESVNRLMEVLSDKKTTEAIKENGDGGDNIPYSDMPRWNLMKVCKAKGIQVATTDTKDDLVKKLNDNSADGR